MSRALIVSNLAAWNERTDAPDVPRGELQAATDHWWVWYPLGRERPDVVLHLRLMATSGPEGAFLVFGTAAHVQEVVDRVAHAWTSLAELRADSGPVAEAVKAAWRDERPRDAATGVRIGERVRLYRTILGRGYQAEAD